MLFCNMQVCGPKKKKHKIQRKPLRFDINLERVMKERPNNFQSMKKTFHKWKDGRQSSKKWLLLRILSKVRQTEKQQQRRFIKESANPGH